MLEFISRYREKRRKLLRAGKAAVCRAQKAGRAQVGTSAAADSLVVLDETLYHCKYGCTPRVTSFRRSVPGERAQPVQFELCSFAQEITVLSRENARLRRLETEAVAMLESKLDTQQEGPS